MLDNPGAPGYELFGILNPGAASGYPGADNPGAAGMFDNPGALGYELFLFCKSLNFIM
jgi:hypothetical protein